MDTEAGITDGVDEADTLVLFAHPAVEHARVAPSLVEVARARPSTCVRDLYELYPDFTIDVTVEQKALLRARRVVMQFPFYWYSAPALMKEWMDLVLTHGFAYGTRGDKLRGKTLALAISTGGGSGAYAEGGYNRFSITDFLRPFEQTAGLCGMAWAQPFVVHDAALLEPAELTASGERYAGWLEALARDPAPQGRVH